MQISFRGSERERRDDFSGFPVEEIEDISRRASARCLPPPPSLSLSLGLPRLSDYPDTSYSPSRYSYIVYSLSPGVHIAQ